MSCRGTPLAAEAQPRARGEAVERGGAAGIADPSSPDSNRAPRDDGRVIGRAPRRPRRAGRPRPGSCSRRSPRARRRLRRGRAGGRPWWRRSRRSRRTRRDRRGPAPRPPRCGRVTVNATVGVRGSVGGGPYSVTPSIARRPLHSASTRCCAPLVQRSHRRDEAGPAVLSLRQRGQEVDRRAGAHDALVVLRARLEPVRRVLGGRLELGQVELLEERLASPEDAHVGPVELVGRAGEEVGAERLHVDERVRRVVDGVHEDEGARRVREVRGAPRRRSSCRGRSRRRRSRGGASSCPSAAARLVQSSWPVSVRMRTASPRGPAPGRAPPGVDVRVVVELGHDDLVARASSRRPSARARWKVSVVMFAPNAISDGPAAQEVGERAARARRARRRSRRSSGRPSACSRCGGAGSRPSRRRPPAAPACRPGRRSRRPAVPPWRRSRAGKCPRMASTGATWTEGDAVVVIVRSPFRAAYRSRARPRPRCPPGRASRGP